MASEPLDKLEETLGYRFKDRSLLLQSLTHSSRRADLQCCNERMEFLGDAILGWAVSDYLYRRRPNFNEGDLTRVKSAIVSRAALARVAKELDLGRYLLVAKGVANIPDHIPPEEVDHNVALPPSLLSNAFEALVAAVFLDSGIRAAYKLVVRSLKQPIEQAASAIPEHNAKSALQERVQRTMGITPVYRLVSEEGPDHGKSFEIAAMINGREFGHGRGRTKKEAEQIAAQATLAILDAENVGDITPQP